MSESPKYSQAELDERRRILIERERERLAEVERRERFKQEEEERKRRLQQAAQFAARAQQEKDARNLINELHSRIFGLKSDTVIMTWCRAEIKEVEDLIGEAEKYIASGEWDIIADKTDRIKNKVSTIIKKAQERQLKEEVRHYIQKGMVSTLKKMGFQVGEPFLSEPGNYESDVIVRARRPDDRFLQVQVPVDGNVSYRIEGYPKRIISGQGGITYSTCDEAQQLIESFHQRIYQHYGIKMGELRWKSKPPQHINKGKKELSDHIRHVRKGSDK